MIKLSYLEAIQNAQALNHFSNAFILGEDVGKRVAFSAQLKDYKVSMVMNV